MDIRTYAVTFRAPGNTEPQSCEVTVAGQLDKPAARQVVHLATGAPKGMIRVLSVVEV